MHVRSAPTATALSLTALASNVATGSGGHSHSDATVAMSELTLVKGGRGGTIKSANTGASPAGEEEDLETLVGSGGNGSVRSPSTIGEERERGYGYPVVRKI